MRVRRLLQPRIRSLVDRIVDGCARLEGGSGDVHDLRTDCRRLRSILSAYAPMLKASPARRVDRDLQRLMAMLGVCRDAEVARDLLEALDPDGRDELDALEAAFAGALAQLRSWLVSPEGRHATERLRAYAANVPWTHHAERPAKRAVARTLDHERRRIRRRAHRARHTHPGDTQDRRLHAVRRAVKQANDASAVASLARSQRRLSKEWREAQDVLGRHHDLVMLRAELRRYEADEQVHLEAVNAEAEAAHADAMRTVRSLGR
ncbi:hypothetical protein Back2_16580 [Nocardioides baekrokdamisoli]|uniref:CHAD domain-containing protein n=1 Tax=Nocardioides baekrokdamisoli TaxID=1804624 RepID=A0A3G9IUP3_9ACTN|nr:CHAD domain-containing protein [Nocardioides baekrokdamisoli]BBH17371.1 hypothetical protein Back2_16580 [Nocardioides baekrokdamisoli]